MTNAEWSPEPVQRTPTAWETELLAGQEFDRHLLARSSTEELEAWLLGPDADDSPESVNAIVRELNVRAREDLSLFLHPDFQGGPEVA